ncbi:MAG: hypothetical protein ABI844_15715 [Saprospiraceae bacterium]
MRRHIFISFLFVLILSMGHAQVNKSIFDCVFNMEGIPTLKLETNWNKLINQKLSEEYIPATLELPYGGKTHIFEVRIRARGNMRKQVCFFPPIKIDFKKGDLHKQKLDTSIDKLKMVFQCKDGSVNSEYLMKEKLAYEIFEVISPDYYVYHKQIKIECTQEGKTKYTLDAMIVEDESELADRINGKVIETGKVMPPALDKDSYLRMAFFQYLIANTDWSIPNKHNVEMIKVPNVAKVIPLAYDFDYAGMVGTQYAVPYETLPIKSVTERYFMAHGITEADALATAKYFVEKKADVQKKIDECIGLDDKDKASITKFFKPFWDIVESEKATKKAFVGQ